jgi:multidrug efflux pump subunit AcrB
MGCASFRSNSFPASDRPELLVDLQLPENASIYATKDASAWLDKLLKDDEDVDHWSSSPTTFSPRP